MVHTQRRSNKYHFDSFWFDPTGARTHDLPPSRRTHQRLHYWGIFPTTCLFCSYFYFITYCYISIYLVFCCWKIEGKQGNGDDTSLNGIELVCGTETQMNTGHTVTSKAGPWGKWYPGFTRCGHGAFLTSFQMQVEKPVVSKNSCRMYSYNGPTYEKTLTWRIISLRGWGEGGVQLA
jgi:hypothetical protein